MQTIHHDDYGIEQFIIAYSVSSIEQASFTKYAKSIWTVHYKKVILQKCCWHMFLGANYGCRYANGLENLQVNNHHPSYEIWISLEQGLHLSRTNYFMQVFWIFTVWLRYLAI